VEQNRDREVMLQQISCSVCQYEIPLSEAVVPEAADYVAYFCSLDCYAAWRTRAADSYASAR
jgi:hypothetical protein